jgi:hypothetical protein
MNLRIAWELSLKDSFGESVDQEFLDWLWESVVRDFSDDELSSADADGETLSAMVALAARAYEARLRFPPSVSLGSGGRPLGSTPKEDVSALIKVDAKTRVQVIALSEYFTKIASVERRVMEFRRRFLGSTTKTLEPDKIPDALRSWSLPEDAETSEHEVILSWTPSDGTPVRYRGTYDSAMGELDRLGEYLAGHYPWGKDQAMHFVLSGDALQVNTVIGSHRMMRVLGPDAHKFNRGTITLEVESWIPPELVKQAYVNLQREVHGGRRVRRGEERNIEVFRFVLDKSQVSVVSESEHLGMLTLLDTWRNLRKSWDKQFPLGHAWRYGEHNGRNFYRDFMRGQRTVIGTEYGLLGTFQPHGQLLKLLSQPGAVFVEATGEEIS